MILNEIILNSSLLILLIVTALASITAKNLISSVVLLAIFSLLMAMEYLVLAAPDVAMTEAAVGSGVSSILFLAAMTMTGIKEKKQTPLWLTILAIISVLVTISAVWLAIQGLPYFGSSTSPANSYLLADYIARTKSDIGISNMVTAILASFRGFDTLGETFVIFCAGISVCLLLDRSNLGKNKKRNA